jgi:hypothetical protein
MNDEVVFTGRNFELIRRHYDGKNHKRKAAGIRQNKIKN